MHFFKNSIVKDLKKRLKNSSIIYFPYYITKMVLSYVSFFINNSFNEFRVKYKIIYPDGKKILKFKNEYLGEKCIIVGNGPSVKMSDLDKIEESKIDSFGSNRIVDIFEETQWRPKYLCIMDPGFLIGTYHTTSPEAYIDRVKKYNIEYLFFTDRLKKYISRIENIFYIKCPLCPWLYERNQSYSEHPEIYISDLGSVTQFIIQLATFMGYTKIYLYGIDNTFVKYISDDGKFKLNLNVENHLSGMSKSDLEDKIDILPRNGYEAYRMGGFSDLRKNNKGYNICSNYTKKNNIKIINLTRGGNLDIFERKDFNEVFKFDE